MTQLPLLPDQEPAIDPRTQVSRMPGTDAPCLCERDDCAERGYPWCNWKTVTTAGGKRVDIYTTNEEAA